MQNFHLPLPDGLYQGLRSTAKRLGKPATRVAREALEAWLREERAAAIHEQITVYARKTAGTAHDLDKNLEDSAVANLLTLES